MARNIALALLAVLFISVSSYSGGNSSMGLASISGEPGQQVQIPIIFRGGSPQIDSVSFDIVVPTEMAFIQAGISQGAQARYKQIRVEPNEKGAHIEIKSWSSHPYYKGAFFDDGELARIIIAIPRDGGMSGRQTVEGPRDVLLTNVKGMADDKVADSFVGLPGVITVVKTRR